MQPEFDTTPIEVVGCGSTLGNLLRFAGSIERTFSFDVDVIGDAVFFVRREISPTELIPDVRGYGHTFPESYTTWNAKVKGPVSHQHIVKYTFGGLCCLVRSERDGYLKEKLSSEEQNLFKSEPTRKANEGTNISSLLQAADSVTVSGIVPTSTDGLKLEPRCRQVPQGSFRPQNPLCKERHRYE